MIAAFGDPSPLPVYLVRDFRLRSAGGFIAARLYLPTATGPLPCLVYAHGGGWALGDLETHDSLCRNLAALAGCAVVSVDYRRPPEHRFPTALDDLCDAVDWARRCAAELGIDASRVAVGGDSAGGNLAAACCLRSGNTERRPVHQLLLLPVVDTRPEAWPSYQLFATGFSMTAEDMQWYLDQYLGPGRPERDNPLAAPYRAPELSGLPGATVITAECDVLRDEAEAYAQRLAASGVPVDARRFGGMFHPFYLFAGGLDEAREAQEYAARQLRRAFESVATT